MSFLDYRIILDIPSVKPSLGFDNYAEAFKGIIQGSEPRFSIGIFGGWGSGKSTLMDEIHGRLDADACIAVPFSAWRYEKEEHLIVPLLDSIRGAVNNWSKERVGVVAEVASKVARTIGGVTESILRGFSIKAGIPQVLEASFDANKALTAAAELEDEEAMAAAPRSFYYASFESLKSCFAEFHEQSGGARIVVFIDDLDRCLPEGALEVLESMKLFFDFDGFVFVVGLDQQVVEWCIDHRYSEGSGSDEEDGFRVRGADYIKKIFQVPFALPPISQRRAEELIDAVSSNIELVPEQREDLRNNVLPHLEHLLAAGNVNLRDVKRFLNSYTLIMKVHHGLLPEVVLALQTVAFHPDWRDIFEALRVHGDDLAREFGNLVQGMDHAVSEIAPELGTIPLSFERYVLPEAPGNVLLNTEDLTQYINLATSATAADLDTDSEGYGFIELLRGVAAARRAMAGDGRALTRENMLERLRNAHDHLRGMEKNVQRVRSMRGGDSLSPLMNRLLVQFDRQLDTFKHYTENDLRELPSDSEYEAVAELGDEFTKYSEAIRQVKQRRTLI
jgi:hypothetical protein